MNIDRQPSTESTEEDDAMLAAALALSVQGTVTPLIEEEPSASVVVRDVDMPEGPVDTVPDVSVDTEKIAAPVEEQPKKKKKKNKKKKKLTYKEMMLQATKPQLTAEEKKVQRMAQVTANGLGGGSFNKFDKL